MTQDPSKIALTSLIFNGMQTVALLFIIEKKNAPNKDLEGGKQKR
jgi:hypothetical protein